MSGLRTEGAGERPRRDTVRGPRGTTRGQPAAREGRHRSRVPAGVPAARPSPPGRTSAARGPAPADAEAGAALPLGAHGLLQDRGVHGCARVCTGVRGIPEKKGHPQLSAGRTCGGRKAQGKGNGRTGAGEGGVLGSRGPGRQELRRGRRGLGRSEGPRLWQRTPRLQKASTPRLTACAAYTACICPRSAFRNCT